MDTQNDFVSLAEQYMDMVFRIAFHDLGSASDADDVTQEVFLRLLRAAPRFDGEAHAKHWLIRVTLNECRRLRLSPWRRRVAPLPEPADAGEVPEQKELLQAVMTLPRKYRAPLYLHYYEGYSTDEVAKLLGCSPGAIRTQLARGRQQLKNILQEDWSDV